MYNASGEPQKAKAAAQQAIDAKLNMADPYLLLVEYSAKEKAFAEAVKWLARLNAEIGENTYSLEGIPEFEELLQSPEYKKFIAEPAGAGK
jgi:hypothetical protein